MSRPAGFIIDVPVTLSVAVRGEGLTEALAKLIALRFADTLDPTDDYCVGYTDSNLTAYMPTVALKVTEATLEPSREETCKVLEELAADDED